MLDQQTISGFAPLNISVPVISRLSGLGITEPTPIQAAAIPHAVEGRDLIGIAQTGTGKTLAFAIPMSERLRRDQVGLVLAPTRELAQQIEETFRKLGQKCALIVGGAGYGGQIRALKGRPQIIIATPGRLMDLMEQDAVRLDRVSIVALDEADRMLDMGFAKAIKIILSVLEPGHQTLLFSATMPPQIAELAKQYLTNPVRVQIDEQTSAPELVDHEMLYLDFDHKPSVLSDLLDDNDGTILVFSRTRHGARKLAQNIRRQGHTAAEIHADRSLNQRREALQGFKSGDYRILVATDIAARGIDVKGISLVVNYDLPDNPEDYIHRIGRTGRAGAKGRAITLALPEQTANVRQIERLLGLSIEVSEKSTVQAMHTHAFSRPSSGGGRRSSGKGSFSGSRSFGGGGRRGR